MGKMAFMAECQRDADRRAKERRERESVAQNLRKMGNQAFRKGEFERAINMYTKALDQIKDSAVLYNNRALSYIRYYFLLVKFKYIKNKLFCSFGLYRRAISDADFVLQKLDEKNLRAWLYRGNGYYLLGEMADFEKSVAEARKGNPKELQYIENVVAAIKGGTAVVGAGDSLVNAAAAAESTVEPSDETLFKIE